MTQRRRDQKLSEEKDVKRQKKTRSSQEHLLLPLGFMSTVVLLLKLSLCQNRRAVDITLFVDQDKWKEFCPSSAATFNFDLMMSTLE